MQFAAGTCASDSLGSILLDPGAMNPTALRPIIVEVNGVDRRADTVMNSLSITDTLGQPVTADFTLVHPESVPNIGDRVRILYFSQVEFAGSIDRVDKTSNDLTTFRYQCQCVDVSQILFRRKVRRSFIDQPIFNVLDSLLKVELLGEPLTIGTIDTYSTIHLVDAKNARAFDVCRDMAAAAGQTFYVDYDRAIQMRSTTSPTAPLVFTESKILVSATTALTDRETYRNVQTVVVTGTPAGSEEVLTTIEQVRNEDQIAVRAILEGGTGIYEEIAEITHPTSNRADDLTILGVSYANIQLSVAGLERTTIKCRARDYGFRAGQLADVNLPTFGVMGSFVIQRVSMKEQDGVQLFHDLELTSSSVQQRAYESWLKIVSGGSKVTVQIPGAITHSSQLYTSAGPFTFVVPAGVTVVTVTVKGGSAGAGGTFTGSGPFHWGGNGGNSGKAISTVNVTQGDSLDVTVGSGGAVGASGPVDANTTAGSSGTLSSVYRLGVALAIAETGTGGQPGKLKIAQGAHGSSGGGSGSIVIVGGGKVGGLGNPYPPQAGVTGEVLIEW